jgi:hypothetical protein
MLSGVGTEHVFVRGSKDLQEGFMLTRLATQACHEARLVVDKPFVLFFVFARCFVSKFLSLFKALWSVRKAMM